MNIYMKVGLLDPSLNTELIIYYILWTWMIPKGKSTFCFSCHVSEMRKAFSSRYIYKKMSLVVKGTVCHNTSWECVRSEKVYQRRRCENGLTRHKIFKRSVRRRRATSIHSINLLTILSISFLLWWSLGIVLCVYFFWLWQTGRQGTT